MTVGALRKELCGLWNLLCVSSLYEGNSILAPLTITFANLILCKEPIDLIQEKV